MRTRGEASERRGARARASERPHDGPFASSMASASGRDSRCTLRGERDAQAAHLARCQGDRDYLARCRGPRRDQDSAARRPHHHRDHDGYSAKPRALRARLSVRRSRRYRSGSWRELQVDDGEPSTCGAAKRSATTLSRSSAGAERDGSIAGGPLWHADGRRNRRNSSDL